MLKLKKLAKFIRQGPELIIVEQELTQLGQITKFWRYAAEFIGGQIQTVQMDQMANVWWYLHKIVVIQEKGGNMLKMKKLRADVANQA